MNLFKATLALLFLIEGLFLRLAHADTNEYLNHPAFQVSEIVYEFTKEYVSVLESNPSTSALDLHPDTNIGFSCDIHNLGSGQTSEVKFSFITQSRNGGRALKLSSLKEHSESEGKDVLKNYTLNIFENSIRGHSDKEIRKIDVKAHEVAHKNLGSNVNSYETYTFVNAAKVSIVQFETIVLVQNPDFPEDYFIEIGSKYSLHVDENQGKLTRSTGAIEYRKVEFSRGSNAKVNIDDVKEKFLLQLMGDTDLPYSFGFKDWAPLGKSKNKDIYQATAIGHCMQTGR